MEMKADTYRELMGILSMISKQDTVFWGGSVIQGYGNKTSDIDIFVITDDVEKFPHSAYNGDLKIFVHIGLVDRYDIEIWDRTHVEKLVNRFIKNYRASEHESYMFLDHEVEFLTNLLIGIPISNKNFFKDLQGKISCKMVNRYLFERRVSLYNNDIEDMEGLILADDWKAAYLRCFELMTTALMCYEARKGDTNIKRKWTVKKLELLNVEKEIIDEFWSLVLSPVVDETKLEPHILKILDFTNSIVSRSQLEMSNAG